MLNSHSSGRKGFTLLEVLIVVTIVGILATLSVSYYSGSQYRSKLNDAASEIVQTLRRAQSKAVAGEAGEPFGVHLESDGFVLFEGSAYVSEGENNESFSLPSGIEAYDISLNGGGSDVVFVELEGSTDDYGSFSIRISGDLSKTVNISEEGAVTWE